MNLAELSLLLPAAEQAIKNAKAVMIATRAFPGQWFEVKKWQLMGPSNELIRFQLANDDVLWISTSDFSALRIVD
jgi:hypothetical protein